MSLTSVVRFHGTPYGPVAESGLGAGLQNPLRQFDSDWGLIDKLEKPVETEAVEYHTKLLHTGKCNNV